MPGTFPCSCNKSENEKELKLCSYRTHNLVGETGNKQQMLKKKKSKCHHMLKGISTIEKERKMEPGKEAYECGAGEGAEK